MVKSILTSSLWKGRDEKDFLCLGGRSEKSILQLTLLLTCPRQHNLHSGVHEEHHLACPKSEVPHNTEAALMCLYL